jgi:dTDP-4-dehydrorhamnose 3,5-epimerase
MTGGEVELHEIAGARRYPAFVADDVRGRFVKVHSDGDDRFPGEDWAEIYYSTSARGVVRGMHLQLPPHDHHKAVHCLAGRALDVVVDLRSDSPTFGRHARVELNADPAELVLVPPGCAHGFQALVDDTVMVYLVSTPYEPSADGGIRWDSFGGDWPLDAVVVSDRDADLPSAAEFAAGDPRPWRA